MPLGVPGQVVGYELPDKPRRTMEHDVASSHQAPSITDMHVPMDSEKPKVTSLR